MTLNVRELLTGAVTNLRWVRRFANLPTVHPETVASHTCYVALYTLFICEWLHTESIVSVDVARALRLALLHDLDECVTGDIPAPAKHDQLDNGRVYRHIGQRLLCGHVLTPLCDGALHERLRTSVDAPNTVEEKIVEVADWLQCVSAVMLEVRSGNPVFIDDVLPYTVKCSDRFLNNGYDFVRSLVDETIELLRTCDTSARGGCDEKTTGRDGA